MLQKGAKIVCIDDVFPKWAKVFYKEFPVKNRVYTLREFGIGLDVSSVDKDKERNNAVLFWGHPNYTVWVEELHNPAHPVTNLEMGFKANRFAPVEEILAQMEAKTKDAISKPVTVPQPQELVPV